MPAGPPLIAAEPLHRAPLAGYTVPIQLPPGLDPAAVPSLVKAMEQAVGLLARSGCPQVLARADRLAELAVGLAEPQFELVEDRMRRQQTLNAVLAGTEWLTAEQINALQPVPPANRSLPASDWKRRGRVFAVNHGGRELFARYQFDAGGQPLPVVKDILAAYGEVADLWALAAWFHFPNAWLARPRRAGGADEPLAPKDLLDDGAAVVHAASQRLRSYVA